jgi:hypothetical protein
MPLTTESSPELMPGGDAKAKAMQQAKPKTRHVLVTRAFLQRGKPVAVGVTVEVDSRFAAELVTANKATYTEPKAEPPKAEPVKAEPPKAEEPKRIPRQAKES